MIVFMDFEYNRTSEEKLNVLCFAWCEQRSKPHSKPRPVIIEGQPGKTDELARTLKLRLREWKKLAKNREEHLFLCSYNVEAEASAFISLGVDPLNFSWIDLYLEYKMLTNHCDRFAYGAQLKDGEVIHTVKKAGRFDVSTKESGVNHSRPSHSLAAAAFKMLSVHLDTDHKNRMRDIIIHGDENRIAENWKDIAEYCKSDAVHLPLLHKSITAALLRLGVPRRKFVGKSTTRGRYAALTAHMTRRGYPVDAAAMKCFSLNVEPMLKELKRDINSKTRDALGFDMFSFPARKVTASGRVYNYEAQQGKMCVKKMQEYVKPKFPDWPLTESEKMPSLKTEIVAFYSGARHDYSNDPLDQLYRYLRTKQSLNGFVPSKDKKRGTIWDSMGSDDRVRPFFNIYGSQSSRSQPSSISNILLKSSWMRVLMQPPMGKMMVSLDYAGQEFLIAGLLSSDETMIDSYMTGDPYMDFARLSKQCPASATKKTHPHVRDVSKPSVLGMLYERGAKSLAEHIAKTAKIDFPESMGRKQIELFKESYEVFDLWKRKKLKEYEDEGISQLVDGWTMFGDNDNWRSVVNFPIQGTGAVVMREAVWNCQKAGIPIVSTLHDALYAEVDSGDMKKVETMGKCMIDAFSSVCGIGDDLSRRLRENPAFVRLDGSIWGPSLLEGSDVIRVGSDRIHEIPLKVSTTYIDGRSVDDYEKFKSFLTVDSFF